MVNVRSNPVYQKLSEFLDEKGIPYSVKDGGKHPLLVFDYAGKERIYSFPKTPSDHRSPLNSVKGLQRLLDNLDQPAPAVKPEPPAIRFDVNDLQVEGDEPRIADMVIAQRLGLKSPYRIRELIKYNREELETYGSVLARIERTRGRGRPSMRFFLNESQSILIAMRSEAPRAPAARKALIEVYSAWRQAHQRPAQIEADEVHLTIEHEPAQESAGQELVAQQPEPAKEVATHTRTEQKLAELLANEDAINLIVDRVVEKVHSVIVTSVKSLLKSQSEWQADNFNRHHEMLQSVASVATVAPAIENSKPEEVAEESQPEVIDQPQVVEEPAYPEVQRDLTVAEIYKHFKIDFEGNRGALSQKMRYSLERYCFKKRINPTVTNPGKSGYAQTVYPKDIIIPWYLSEGQKIIERAQKRSLHR